MFLKWKEKLFSNNKTKLTNDQNVVKPSKISLSFIIKSYSLRFFYTEFEDI